ncbi:MAG: hypothetical protein SOT15_07555 [Treponema sp.]|nr:hypothetical protein [Treponema sp.]MDY2924735.1 hypothetical protein [Treponema sp.]
MDRWEYRRGEAIGQNLEQLNELGKQGWEVVTTVQGSLLLKRKLPSAPTQSVSKPAQSPNFDDDFGIRF